MTLPRTVHIVDDDPGVRDALALLLRLHGYAPVEYASGDAILAVADASTDGCILLDVRMGETSGLDVQAELQRRGVNAPVIVLTAYGDAATARAALKGGAFDFLEKPLDAAALMPLVESAMAAVSRRHSSSERHLALRRRMERLTPRERQVFELVVAGRHNREIGAALDISPRTVEVYKARMMEKLGVERLPDLIRLSLEVRGPDPGAAAGG